MIGSLTDRMTASRHIRFKHKDVNDLIRKRAHENVKIIKETKTTH